VDREDLRIIFLGNPEFAKIHLLSLLDHGFNVVAVVAAADKESGRGMRQQSTAVAQLAKERRIPLLQPLNLKNPAFLDELRSFRADLQVVVAFRMLPEQVWNMPPLGSINLHASLLPDYRGAAPINWVIINGEKQTGVTTFKLRQEIDTGNILLQESCELAEDETAGSLHDRLMKLGAELTIRTVEGILDQSLAEKRQEFDSNQTLKAAPKIHSSDCQIHWDQNGEQISRLIRGLKPYPTAFAVLKELRYKIYEAGFERAQTKLKPGTIETDQIQFIRIACADGWIYLKEIQAAGKRKMAIEEFLRGHGEKF
jgi:methionyl-tRNA formyltransferase